MFQRFIVINNFIHRTSNVEFQNVMTILEGSNHCENLDLRSFLLSPMQRVTRYPLLLNAVLRRTVEGSEEFLTAEKALSLSNQMANDCNETARKFERIEQLVDLDKKFVYEVLVLEFFLTPAVNIQNFDSMR